mmetsp:Transcript_29112/g.72956  ORF Transcript_29112/g.72956 Transcript_29112/m.72956 type:complete len:525 (+) Transcript_29112:166-1740(+)
MRAAASRRGCLQLLLLEALLVEDGHEQAERDEGRRHERREERAPAVLLHQDGDGHAGVGGAQVGDPAQEALRRSYSLGAGNLGAAQPHEHLRAVDEEADHEDVEPLQRARVAGDGGEQREHGAQAQAVAGDHPDAHAHRALPLLGGLDEVVGQPARNERARQPAKLQAAHADCGHRGIGDALGLNEVEDEPGGDALADGVHKEVRKREEIQRRLAQHVLHQRLHDVGLLLLAVLDLLLHVGSHGLVACSLGRVLHDDEQEDAHHRRDRGGHPQAVLPTVRPGSKASHQRRRKAAKVVRHVPHAPVGAALRRREPGGQHAGAGGRADALQQPVGDPEAEEPDHGAAGAEAEVDEGGGDEAEAQERGGGHQVAQHAAHELGHSVRDGEHAGEHADLRHVEHALLHHDGRGVDEGVARDVVARVAEHEAREDEQPVAHKRGGVALRLVLDARRLVALLERLGQPVAAHERIHAAAGLVVFGQRVADGLAVLGAQGRGHQPAPRRQRAASRQPRDGLGQPQVSRCCTR